ncbi:trk system potassium uptake protein TrkH [Cohaesibacter sp. ES.047]|uniref:TrkH family potassium uptake protein n=1 Tax=Cohaesibacter sp. ES.047 TaxID=1798205 RepID=UPI000BB7B2E7|nr:TrkH family potassium uptake protein [Cohaesibacter sp. ES.047]SNY93923.1 trk system potassium uptake protein TrkH [Cohaesibacter sp. ES.047]
MLSALGILIAALGGLMFVPAIIDLAIFNEDWQTFVGGGAISVAFGVALFLAMRGQEGEWTIRKSIMFVNGIWISVSLFASLPLYFSSLHLSFVDAFFETVSGLTTTGSTVLSGLDTMAPGLLFWRSFMQWIGGLGIVAISVTILPMIGSGGQRLFFLESSEQSDNPYPRIREFAAKIALVYSTLTLACALSYYLLGMTFFEAINHAMTTLSTGGYSTSDNSMGHFNSLGILSVASLFMFFGGMPFLYMIRFFSADRPKDPQISLYLYGVIFATLVIFFFKQGLAPGGRVEDLVLSLFDVISIVTTTGYGAGDYQLWGPLFGVFFFVLTFFGGCSGSTAGGLKQFRFVVSWLVIKEAAAKLIYPNRAVPTRYGMRVVDNAMAASTLCLVFLFFATFVVFAILLQATGLDFVTAISASATAVANVGPGLGDIIGPAGNFSSLPDFAKWLLAIEMILGRLEILSGLALFTYDFWRW